MENPKFMTKISRMPDGTTLSRGKDGHGYLIWTGVINSTDVEEPVIGPVSNPDLGTVIDQLLILKSRGERDARNED